VLATGAGVELVVCGAGLAPAVCVTGMDGTAAGASAAGACDGNELSAGNGTDPGGGDSGIPLDGGSENAEALAGATI
jgi:hypothetical protein